MLLKERCLNTCTTKIFQIKYDRLSDSEISEAKLSRSTD